MINASDIIAAAEQETGLSTSSVEQPVLDALNRYVDSLNNEAPLNDRGWQNIQGTLVKSLSNRLRVNDYLDKHPELLERPIEKPLFVFGLPRTGTTLVINLLAADPGRRSLLRWEALDSVPPPKPDELSAGERYEKEQAKLDMSIKYAPHISAIHHEDADSPTECQFAMSQSFCAQYYEAIAEVPSYRHWLLYEADYLPAFRYHKRLLQLLQAEATGRWTLKNPWHPLFLDALTEVYPDAQLVMTHRDPVDVVASACSLTRHVREMFSDNVDKHLIGETALETFDLMIQRAEAYKQKHGEDAIYDLQYADLMGDPIGELKKIYNHFDAPWTDRVESAMRDSLAANPKGKFGKHEYSLEEYGLSKDQVREYFRDYCERFDIPQKN